MEDAPYDGKDWTCLKVTRAAMADRFAAYCVLLVGKDENNKGGREQGCGGRSERIDWGAVVPKADVGKGKRVWFLPGDGVFAGTEQEKESQPN
jgi:hypothetical protein